MKIAELDFPDPILSALRDQSLVVFAGAGVSMGEPACLPSFRKLTEKIAEGTGHHFGGREPEDRFLGKLKHQKVDVHKRAADILSGGNPAPTDLHKNLIRLSREVGGIRIVTTNFDLLFEQATNNVFDSDPEIFKAPALPMGRDFSGIVHIHGTVSDHQRMILTDADFGRAYLTEGWARRYLVDLFNHFPVLFVGYSHKDIILNYLARALPVMQSKPRFALTKVKKDLQKERQRWEVLGIEPVFYPKLSDEPHIYLYQGIQKLAEYNSLGVLDWKRIITDLAQKGPSLDEEAMSLVREALSDPNKVHFFTGAAPPPRWIDWLDKEKFLDGLFGSGDLSKVDSNLANWLATKIAIPHSEELFRLIGRHDTQLNPEFWFRLSHEVAMGNQEPTITKEEFARWVSLLLTTATAKTDHHALLRLGEACVQHKLKGCLLNIFDSMADFRIQIASSFSWSNDQRLRNNVELQEVNDYFCIEELWKEGIKPNLDQLAEPLLGRVIRHLEILYFKFSAWNQESSIIDPIGWSRSTIESYKQYRDPNAVDVLIDAARDCLGWLARYKEPAAAFWSDRLSTSKAPILRRLSVYTVSRRDGLTADDKIEWLLKDRRLHDLPAQHEIFNLARAAYPKASLEQRKFFLAAVREYRWQNEEEPNREVLTSNYRSEWFHWLHNLAPDCILTKQTLNEFLAAYPDFTPNEYTDLKHVRKGGGFGSVHQPSPWSVEDLLDKSAANWLPELLDHLSCEVIGPDRHKLILAIEDAAKRDFTWGLELADSLANEQEWEIDLWDALLRVWASIELDEAKHRELLSRLQIAELYPKRHLAIARMLRDWVTDGNRPYIYHLLEFTNKIAINLWLNHDGDDLKTGLGSNWLTQAINHSSGVLTEYWISALALARKKGGPLLNVHDKEFRLAFSAIVENKGLAGRFGRSVLAGQFPFMLNFDEGWTIENLLPYFSTPDEDDFRAIWDGFLTWGHLNPRVAEVLYGPFLQAVERFLIEPKYPDLARFVQYYTTMLSFFAKNPTDILENWIPTLLKHDDDLIRKQFAWKIGSLLRDLNDVQQHKWWKRWLKYYWENRLVGIPAPLKTSEINSMLEWLPHLTAVFAAAVNLANQMPLVPLTRGLVFRKLKDSKVFEDHPETVGKLLVNLGKADSPDHVWHSGKELVYELLQKDGLLPEIKCQLIELAAKQGWNDILT